MLVIWLLIFTVIACVIILILFEQARRLCLKMDDKDSSTYDDIEANSSVVGRIPNVSSSIPPELASTMVNPEPGRSALSTNFRRNNGGYDFPDTIRSNFTLPTSLYSRDRSPNRFYPSTPTAPIPESSGNTDSTDFRPAYGM